MTPFEGALIAHEGNSSALLEYSRVYQTSIVFATQPRSAEQKKQNTSGKTGRESCKVHVHFVGGPDSPYGKKVTIRSAQVNYHLFILQS